jgi:hypothetical protein
MVNPNNKNTINGIDEPWSSMKILTIDKEMEQNRNLLQQQQQQQQQQPQSQRDQDGSQSQNQEQVVSWSTYERLRHFFYINFALNKRSFILSILSYISDLLLFIALNLYLFSNKSFTYETKCELQNELTTRTAQIPILPFSQSNVSINVIAINATLNSSQINKANEISSPWNNTHLEHETRRDLETHKTKQSYLTLQIIFIFVFFICFIMSYLIKLQLKYHRLALNLYDYDTEANRDRDGTESLASSTTISHFSSSNHNKKLTSLLKRLLNRLFTKLTSILLNLFFGYQFCQNCFIENGEQISKSPFSIFTHIFISLCVIFRCAIVLVNKKNSINQLNNLKKLQHEQTELFDQKNPNYNYYFYYYSYLLKSNQNQCNQLKQHQTNQFTFRIFQLDDISLFIGFTAALFHLFTFLRAFELVFVFLPLLFALILFRFKSLLSAVVNLLFIFVSILIISNTTEFNSIGDISSAVINSNIKNFSGLAINPHPVPTDNKLALLNSTLVTSTAASIKDSIIEAQTLTTLNPALTASKNSSKCNGQLVNLNKNNSSIISLLSYNLFTFFCFLLTFYMKSLLSIYYCTLTSLERWNISFLSKLSFWRKLLIYLSFLVYLVFILACTIALCIKLSNWSFLFLPIYFLISFVWCCFQLLNTVNLIHLMNKISDCYLLVNESNSLSNTNSFENASNLSKRSKYSQQNNNRHSTLSQSSNINKSSSSFMLFKFLQRFLSYNKLNINEDAPNIPIHRILAYKGVRHLGSISYRICLYCFAQTILLAPFVFYTSSPITIGFYLISLSINFIWISLLYQFPKSVTGTCIAYALVAPPLLMNFFNNNSGTIGSSTTSSTTLTSSKKYKTNGSSSTSTSHTTNSSKTNYSNTTDSSMMFLPFNYQQALGQRCKYILNKIQSFLQFHLIENYGCDYASTGVNKESLETKIRSFFAKCATDGSYYNTYILYYCGPTSNQTDNILFTDGNELSIEQVVNYWKEIHCDQESEIKKKHCIKSSRLIIMLDAENTSKSLQYVKSKLSDANVYVALQSVKYNANSLNNKSEKGGIVNRVLINDKSSNNLNSISNKAQTNTIVTMAPGSPQTFSSSFFDSYLNIGKFTLDWIKSNSNSSNINTYENELDSFNPNENFVFNNLNSRHDELYEEDEEDEENEKLHRDEDDDEDDDDDDDDQDDESNESNTEQNTNNNRNNQNNLKSATGTGGMVIGGKEMTIANNKSKKSNKHVSSSVYYEAKCAFSRHWIDFKFEDNEKTLINDFNQFWSLYYPSAMCKPLLKLINCKIFYLRFEHVKRVIFWLRHLKNKLIPIHEYDTGHGFKLFSS